MLPIFELLLEVLRNLQIQEQQAQVRYRSLAKGKVKREVTALSKSGSGTMNKEGNFFRTRN